MSECGLGENPTEQEECLIVNPLIKQLEAGEIDSEEYEILAKERADEVALLYEETSLKTEQIKESN